MLIEFECKWLRVQRTFFYRAYIISYRKCRPSYSTNFFTLPFVVWYANSHPVWIFDIVEIERKFPKSRTLFINSFIKRGWWVWSEAHTKKRKIGYHKTVQCTNTFRRHRFYERQSAKLYSHKILESVRRNNWPQSLRYQFLWIHTSIFS